jgi:hypothetical protein
MEVRKLCEAGYEPALYGLSTSFMPEGIPFGIWWTPEKMEQMEKLAPKQAQRDGGHNKFLESIITWYSIRAPRGWWQEYDTYRLETKQSASTMHTIQHRALTPDDFEEHTPHIMIDAFNEVLFEATDEFRFQSRLSGVELQKVKWSIPEGYLQTRQVRLSYKTIRNMTFQRWEHRLEQWQTFIKAVYDSVDHRELLPEIPYG